MAISKQTFYERLKRFYPNTFKSEETLAQASHMWGVSAILAEFSLVADEHIDDTFITLASIDSLRALGEERSIIQLPNEDIDGYRVRVRNIINQSNRVSIKQLVDGFLVAGEATILEDDITGHMFCSRRHFIARGEIIVLHISNGFSIIVDYQGQAQGFYESITNVINSVKAFGTAYRFRERVLV